MPNNLSAKATSRGVNLERMLAEKQILELVLIEPVPADAPNRVKELLDAVAKAAKLEALEKAIELQCRYCRQPARGERAIGDNCCASG